MDKQKSFQNNIATKFQIYNSLFLTLPFDQISNVGLLLPLLAKSCHAGFLENKNPQQIIDDFFEKHTEINDEKSKISLFFKFIQYIERQVVLFDAIEDAAYETIHDFNGNGTIPYVFNRAVGSHKSSRLIKKLKDFKAKIVLTAHPTQFYQGMVLSIVKELENAIRKDDLENINVLLQQLGRTAFVNKSKPTPYDEATRLMWYLENVFYHSVATVHSRLREELARLGVKGFDKDVIQVGFWPGGDRDGNPFVTSEITLKTAKELKRRILLCYFRDAKKLRQRITFSGVSDLVENVYNKLSASTYNTIGEKYRNKTELIEDLSEIEEVISKQHNGLFVEVVEDFIVKVKLFGFYFTSLDIRQDSRVHGKVLNDIFSAFHQGRLAGLIESDVPQNYDNLSEKQQIEVLQNLKGKVSPEIFEDELTRETLKSIYAIQEIQQQNGVEACHRYIISNTQSTKNIMEVYALARLCGWNDAELALDVTPLLETIDDLSNGKEILSSLYNNPVYKKHLQLRKQRQFVMLGYSDGTKDGGYLRANWSIFKAKLELSELSKKYGVDIVFFDGRGGPPARGGGNTNKFYSSLGDKIANHEIELTIQGQTISSNYGTLNSSRYNLEQLLCSGLENSVFKGDVAQLNGKQMETIGHLADLGYEAYRNFKSDPLFIDYLENVSVLKYYGLTNVGSRPVKRTSAGKLTLSDLRAIPFVGAWTQMKQNVPGFYGVGTALKHYEDGDKLDEIKKLYKKSLFFRTLIDNSMQSLCKSYFPLTSYLQNDKKFSQFWQNIHDEFQLTKRLVLEISGQKQLLENAPNTRASIEIRENIILPLITIQQYALMQVKAMERGERSDELKSVYEKIIIRAFFGSINASRNAA
ncbi:MAG TPA: phosphoenolpyruvate carboxylase [Gammaproteobacteria bacterium]|nr:phosphoenolpyruvate carboxylase [Xanthomonadales bacterium]MCB1594032.1 phosphoenolpyruvate carboxylase [Xanthomonadales bacterium]HOP23425.1 phosphoenolpyruvate carboxylase [Gammaproteobacteria bacterium]HPI96855.1 phosphoenolpyruvate carboxylase [Gammaproteobacteria bacterium]HPQ88287.1 phosphoenolpyruvate carboxylase [Gammaproteobacteria bacterium]